MFFKALLVSSSKFQVYSPQSSQRPQRKTLGWVSQKAIKAFNAEGRGRAIQPYRIQCSVFLFISGQALHHLYRFRFEPEMMGRKRMYYPEKL